MIGFLHAGEGSRRAVEAALAARGRGGSVAHLVDPTLVDGSARDFPITDERYETIRERARDFGAGVERIVLACSVYNGVAGRLSEDLGIPTERSDAAGFQVLRGTRGPLGILLSYRPSIPIVLDYASEVFARDENPRELRVSVAADVSPFDTDPEEYRAALLEAMQPLRGCDALFVAQYTMEPHVPALRAAWSGNHVVSALGATLDAFG